MSKHKKRRVLGKVRGLIYKVGLRPRQGSIFYSPSLALIFGFRKAFKKAIWK